jgi:hypothetical protein
METREAVGSGGDTVGTEKPARAQGSEVRLRRVGLELLTASFLVLFLELTLIRWLPAQVRVLAYFPNLILLSAFLGLGLGCLRAGRGSLLWVWPTALLLTVATAFGLSHVAFTQNAATEHLWLLYYDLPSTAPVVPDVRLPIVLAFVLSTLVFVPLGQLVAERLRVFQARSSALWGYCLDILGSLLGVITFAAFGFLGTFPVAWFACVLAGGLLYFVDQRRGRVLYAVVAALTLTVVVGAERAGYYSPYYALGSHRNDDGSVSISANGSLHQTAVPLQRAQGVSGEWLQSVRDGYHAPYRVLREPPKRVLVLGAGTGNDVAVALDEGAEHVDAVEIDPVILGLGRDVHPNRPYDSPRVRTVTADARSFLNESTEQYDLIVFGTLDSMTRLSALSNVRLDNFVYTLDCLRAARARLSARGGVLLYFMVGTSYIDERLARMLYEVFEEPPMIFRRYAQLFNNVYAAGPAFAGVGDEERAAIGEFFATHARPELPTDDWPYLYLVGRSISGFYLTLMAIIAGLAVLAVAAVSVDVRRSVIDRRPDVEMFCFGLAFLLLETKSVTAMNLVWGATWLTSAVVFGAILATILLATLVVQVRGMPWAVCVAGLVVSLLVAYAVPSHVFLRLDPALKLLLSSLFVGTPIFFASACFALLFRERADTPVALGWNLLGAVAGGLLEFLSMMIGLRELSLLALVAYLVAVLVHHRSTRTVPVQAAPTFVAARAG